MLPSANVMVGSSVDASSLLVRPAFIPFDEALATVLALVGELSIPVA